MGQIRGQDFCLWRDTTKLYFDLHEYLAFFYSVAQKNKFIPGDLRPQKCSHFYSSFSYFD